MRQYRILQVHNFYQIPGGEDVVVRNEKRLLEEHGHKVYTYYRSNEELRKMGLWGKLRLPATAVYSPKTKREVQRLIKEHRIDVVHVHNTLTVVSPSVFYAAFRCHVPVVQTLHNFRMLCPAGSFFRDNRICEECLKGGLSCAVKHRCYRNSKVQSLVSAAVLKIHRILGTYRKVNFICLTEFNREKMLQLPGLIDEKKVYVKPNFTFREETAAEKKEQTEKAENLETAEKTENAENLEPAEKTEKAENLEPAKKAEKAENPEPAKKAENAENPESRSSFAGEDYYLFVGRIEALKGVEVALKAFELLPERNLYLAGDGDLSEEMKAYVREHGMENIRFLGRLDKDTLADCYRHAKALIMSSQCYETFGMTAAEAYSYGVPVIAGKIGNLDGMVEDGVTGVKFRYNSPEDLAGKVKEFERLDRSSLSRNARAFYEARMLPEDNYRKLMEIYEKISDRR